MKIIREIISALLVLVVFAGVFKLVVFVLSECQSHRDLVEPFDETE